MRDVAALMSSVLDRYSSLVGRDLHAGYQSTYSLVDVEAMLTAAGVPFNADIVRLYSRFNAPNPLLMEDTDLSLFQGMLLERVEDVVQSYPGMSATDSEQWYPGRFPLLRAPWGDQCVVEASSGVVLFLPVDPGVDDESVMPLFPTLADLLESIVQCHDAGVYSFDGTYIDENHDLLVRLMSARFPTLASWQRLLGNLAAPEA